MLSLAKKNNESNRTNKVIDQNKQSNNQSMLSLAKLSVECKNNNYLIHLIHITVACAIFNLCCLSCGGLVPYARAAVWTDYGTGSVPPAASGYGDFTATRRDNLLNHVRKFMKG